MKIVVAKTDLVNLIGKIQTIVPSKPSSPVLINFLFEAVDDQIICSMTNLTVSMRCYCDAKVIEEGAIALPARRFFQLIRELTASQVKISTLSDDICEISAGTSVFKIHGLSKGEFPEFPDLTNAPEITMKSSELKRILSCSSFSAAKEDSKYALSGVCLKIANQKATFLATDGKRLSKVVVDIDLDPSFQGSYVLPGRAVDEMIKLLDNDEGEAILTLMSDKIAIEKGNLTLVSKFLSAKYPDVERVIPETSIHTISLHREELIALLRQVALFTSENASSVRFLFEKGKLHLSAVSREFGEGDVDMAVDYRGEPLRIAFNPLFFGQILNHLEGDVTVTLDLTDGYSPGKITGSSTALFMIMPMHLEEIETESVSSLDQSPALT